MQKVEGSSPFIRFAKPRVPPSDGTPRVARLARGRPVGAPLDLIREPAARAGAGPSIIATRADLDLDNATRKGSRASHRVIEEAETA